MTDLSAAYQQVLARIRAAEAAHGRPTGAVALLAVSKTKPADAIRALHDCGQRAFGENYVQEALSKQEALAELDLEWHFIGPIQANKTKSIAERFDWVHSVDRLKILRRLAEQRPSLLPPLNVCLQVNVDAEPTKAGVTAAELPALARAAAELPNLRLRGLMAIPRPRQGFAQQRAAFATLRGLAEQLAAEGIALDTLSMGMSDDLEAAVAEGASLVRVGSALFGAR